MKCLATAYSLDLFPSSQIFACYTKEIEFEFAIEFEIEIEAMKKWKKNCVCHILLFT